ncbi:MAG: hypothetical protein ACLS29_09310 [Prevotellamassilia sp.]
MACNLHFYVKVILWYERGIAVGRRISCYLCNCTLFFFSIYANSLFKCVSSALYLQRSEIPAEQLDTILAQDYPLLGTGRMTTDDTLSTGGVCRAFP